MQFPMTAEVFHVTLKSFFVISSLISNYTLKHDEWIVTRPEFKDVPSTERKRWIGIFKTSLSYAVMEPLWYWLMTTVSNQSGWWLMMGCLMHAMAIPGSIVIMGECFLEVRKKHDEICGDTKELAKEEEGKANEENEKAEPASQTDVEKSGEKPPPPQPDLRPCMDRHPLSKIYPFVPLWPVATAAMANAGLLFYTRYLHSEDSQTWFDRFAFGWTAIALLCASLIIISRRNNKMIHQACGRPLHLYTVPWDVLKYRLVALVAMNLVRAVVRSLLGQIPYPWFIFTADNQIRLIGDVDVSDGPGTSPDNKKHLFDRILAAIPPWVCTTISVSYCVWIWSYIIYSRWQKRRQQRAQQQGGE